MQPRPLPEPQDRDVREPRTILAPVHAEPLQPLLDVWGKNPSWQLPQAVHETEMLQIAAEQAAKKAAESD